MSKNSKLTCTNFLVSTGVSHGSGGLPAFHPSKSCDETGAFVRPAITSTPTGFIAYIPAITTTGGIQVIRCKNRPTAEFFCRDYVNTYLQNAR